MSRSTERRSPGPGVGDWAWLLGSLAFVAMGAFIFVKKPADRAGAVATTAFFAACAGVAAINVARKLRFSRLRPLRVEVVGGTPIRPPRSSTIGGGLLMLALGIVIGAFGGAIGTVFSAIGWLIAAVGGALLLGVATRRLPVGFLQFDPEGLTVGHRAFAFTIPWDRIARVASGEYHHNPVLLLWLDDLDAVRAHPPEYQASMAARLAYNEQWTGAHVQIMASNFGIDLPLLAAAVSGYIADPVSRASLGRPRLDAAATTGTGGPR